jgi:hypothetical protein
MKICPNCRKTYTDDGLNFCLEDGSILTFATEDKLPETVLVTPPRSADPNPTLASQPGIYSTYGSQAQQYTVQPKKSSKTWIWVLGIFAVLALVCGGGFVGFFAFIASQNNTKVTPTPTGSPGKSGPTATPFQQVNVQVVDLSEWVKESSTYGTTEFTGGEFIMGSKEKGYYYVLVAPAEYKTDSATTKVTARNVNDANTTLGFGLIFHSDPNPLTKDYAFLIDSKKKKYRVVRHEPEKEVSMVSWTNSSAIKDGTQENILEARDKGGNIELYINGQLTTSIKNTHGYKGGVAGLYSGDAVKIGFKNLEIRK